MKVILVEDELSACENFIYLLEQIDSEIEVVKILDGVKLAVEYFKNNVEVDLVFMDIHLSDGIAFEIFENVEVDTPIIFTTAYDQYAIKAFKVNSVDYLLKPIKKSELENAIEKFQNNNFTIKTNLKQIQQTLEELKLQNKKYKSTFLVHQKDALIPVEVNDFAYFYIKSGIIKGITKTNKSFVINEKMENLEAQLDTTLFYRINRQFIIQRHSVQKISYPFNRKLTISVKPEFNEPIQISKLKSKQFKDWIREF